MRYEDAIAFLDSLITGRADVPYTARHAFMARLLGAMGDPQKRFRAVHVAGTSGKGSTCAFLDAVYRAAGLKTGLHTTPYLQSPLEKIQIDGRPLAPDDLATLVAQALLPVLAGESARPTYVQAWTALTFAWFAHQQADIAVIEASLGGRFDATNHLYPSATIITNVHLDHTASLGARHREIAWHKAGIAKSGVPMVTSAQHPDAIEVIEAECRAAGSPLSRLNKDFSYTVKRLDACGAVFDYQDALRTYRDLEITMLGEHQVANAAVALAALKDVGEPPIRKGLRDATIPGRLEVAQQEPLVLLDGAHNPAKAEALRTALDRVFPNREVVLLLALGAAKDAEGVVQALAPHARVVVCTEAPVAGKPACPAALLARGLKHAVAQPDPDKALDQALDLCRPNDLLCVTGSLYLVGALRGRWHPLQ